MDGAEGCGAGAVPVEVRVRAEGVRSREVQGQGGAGGMRAHGAGACSPTEEPPEGATGVTPLGLEEKCPPPCSGPTDRAPGRAGQWLPPRGAFKVRNGLEQKRRRQKTDR